MIRCYHKPLCNKLNSICQRIDLKISESRILKKTKTIIKFKLFQINTYAGLSNQNQEGRKAVCECFLEQKPFFSLKLEAK